LRRQAGAALHVAAASQQLCPAWLSACVSLVTVVVPPSSSPSPRPQTFMEGDKEAFKGIIMQRREAEFQALRRERERRLAEMRVQRK
jgi:hypothetical protein